MAKDREFMQASEGRSTLVNGLNAVILAAGAAALAVLGLAVTRDLTPVAVLAATAFVFGLGAALWTVIRNLTRKPGPNAKLLPVPLVLFILEIALLITSVVLLILG